MFLKQLTNNHKNKYYISGRITLRKLCKSDYAMRKFGTYW